jgi:ribose-phosphate pyrophosphokinase
MSARLGGATARHRGGLHENSHRQQQSAAGRAMAAYLNLPLTQASIRRFSDMEVFVIRRTSAARTVRRAVHLLPANDNLMELLVCIDALKRSSAHRRPGPSLLRLRPPGPQIRPCTPISASWWPTSSPSPAPTACSPSTYAGQIRASSTSRPTTSSPPCSPRTSGEAWQQQLTIVSRRRRRGAGARHPKRLEADLAIIDKRLERAGVSEVMNIIGDVDGRRCILVDDIVDSAGTLCNAAVALKEQGAMSVAAYVTHGVLSGGAVARVAASPIDSLVITDSIAATEAVRFSQKIRR